MIGLNVRFCGQFLRCLYFFFGRMKNYGTRALVRIEY